MQHSVTLHRPQGEVLAGLWNSQPPSIKLLEMPFPAGPTDGELFLVNPSREWQAGDIEGFLGDGYAVVLGKLIVPKLIVAGSSETIAAYPEGVKPTPRKLLKVIEREGGSKPIHFDDVRFSISREFVVNQAKLFAKLTPPDRFQQWYEHIQSGKTSAEDASPYIESYNIELPQYQRYIGFLCRVYDTDGIDRQPELDELRPILHLRQLDADGNFIDN